jgi:catechol 2,3-dioxygenase-like lactoylglutathione lyase family enzyme
MKANVHLHLVVTDLPRSAAFYERLFGPPVKIKDGYRKFLPKVAPLNLALSQRSEGEAPHGIVSHLGIQFDTPREVQVELERVKALGIPVHEEMGVACCHANQDKFWVRDPDGLEWEFYNVNFDIEEAPRLPAPAVCSPTAPHPGATAERIGETER